MGKFHVRRKGVHIGDGLKSCISDCEKTLLNLRNAQAFLANPLGVDRPTRSTLLENSAFIDHFYFDDADNALLIDLSRTADLNDAKMVRNILGLGEHNTTFLRNRREWHFKQHNMKIVMVIYVS